MSTASSRTGSDSSRLPHLKIKAPVRTGAFIFKWGNLLLSLPVRLDAVLMPRSLSTVLLIEAVRDGDDSKRSR